MKAVEIVKLTKKREAERAAKTSLRPTTDSALGKKPGKSPTELLEIATQRIAECGVLEHLEDLKREALNNGHKKATYFIEYPQNEYGVWPNITFVFGNSFRILQRGEYLRIKEERTFLYTVLDAYAFTISFEGDGITVNVPKGSASEDHRVAGGHIVNGKIDKPAIYALAKGFMRAARFHTRSGEILDDDHRYVETPTYRPPTYGF